MGLSIGIVGLPNVGKSTLFNALTEAQNAEAANYPFCTIEPNKAIVAVKDARLKKIAEMIKPQKLTFATVDFFDIAGLVKGASKGEGLGNQFLSNIRQTDAIVHVVRCFEDENVVHVEGSIDPLRDIEVIETELLLADVQSLQNKIERMQKAAKGDKTLQQQISEGEALLNHLNEGNPVSTFAERSEQLNKVVKELGLLTAKEIIYCANVDENSIAKGNKFTDAVKNYAEKKNSSFVIISAKMEEELISLSEEEKIEYLKHQGAEESGLELVIHTGYRKLNLISYFTAGVKEVRAWTIHKGDKAPRAAAEIHTDFEKGFIRAEVICYDDYIKHGSEAACKNAGVMRTEGKDYIVQDGDVVHFLFNV